MKTPLARTALAAVAVALTLSALPTHAEAVSRQNSKAEAAPICAPERMERDSGQTATKTHMQNREMNPNQTSINRYPNGDPESPRGTDSVAPITSK
jgi:hypothetical protein